MTTIVQVIILLCYLALCVLLAAAIPFDLGPVPGLLGLVAGYNSRRWARALTNHCACHPSRSFRA